MDVETQLREDIIGAVLRLTMVQQYAENYPHRPEAKLVTAHDQTLDAALDAFVAHRQAGEDFSLVVSTDQLRSGTRVEVASLQVGVVTSVTAHSLFYVRYPDDPGDDDEVDLQTPGVVVRILGEVPDGE